jgi:hypothetical protein
MFFINPFIYAGGGDFESIATVTVGSGGAASVEFTSISGSYQHLQVRYVTRCAGSTGNRVNLNINGDTTNSAYWHSLYGTGSSAAAYTISTAYIQVGSMPVSTDTASVFGVGVIDILDYASASKNRVVRSFAGHDLNGSGLVLINSGARYNTDAVTSLKFTTNTAQDFAQHTTFALYGVKAP